MKELDEYQRIARTFLLEKFNGLPRIELVKYCALGINEEAGEVAGKIKKSIRDDETTLEPSRTEAIAFELGDTLWYLALLAETLGISLSRIAEMNIEKLSSRKDRGVIKGEGDNR